MNSAILIVSGIAMLTLAGFVMYLARPREGKPAFFLARSDSGSTLLIMTLLAIALFGIGFLVKGVAS